MYLHEHTAYGPKPSPWHEPATVYIARDAGGSVLYVGVTGRNIRRLHAHQKASGWWRDAATIELEHYPTREIGEARERILIRQLDPPHNVADRTPA